LIRFSVARCVTISFNQLNSLMILPAETHGQTCNRGNHQDRSGQEGRSSWTTLSGNRTRHPVVRDTHAKGGSQHAHMQARKPSKRTGQARRCSRPNRTQRACRSAYLACVVITSNETDFWTSYGRGVPVSASPPNSGHRWLSQPCPRSAMKRLVRCTNFDKKTLPLRGNMIGPLIRFWLRRPE
jgi:hypothetical protein